MENKNKIINFLVITALLGYIFCSLKLFAEAFTLFGLGTNEPSLVFMNITSALTGLVGGIVAAGFGVTIKKTQKPEALQNPNGPQAMAQSTIKSFRALKFESMGSMATAVDDDKKREKMGRLYAWSYVIIGLIAVIIWIVENDTSPQSIASMGTTFLGMVIAIVSSYFKPTI